MGAKLKRFREEHGMSVSELARVSKRDRTYIHDIEAGRGNPTLDIYAELLSHCGVDFEEFLAGFRSDAIPSDDQDFHRMLSIILNSGIGELRQGIHVNLEAISEKAVRLKRARAGPSPASGGATTRKVVGPAARRQEKPAERKERRG